MLNTRTERITIVSLLQPYINKQSNVALVIAYETNNEHTISLLDMSPYLTVYHDKQVICKCQRANSTFSVLRHIKERI